MRESLIMVPVDICRLSVDIISKLEGNSKGTIVLGASNCEIFRRRPPVILVTSFIKLFPIYMKERLCAPRCTHINIARYSIINAVNVVVDFDCVSFDSI